MEKDKKLHFYAGLALSLVAGLFIWPFLPPLPWWLRWLIMWGRPGFGLWAAAIAGALKEIVWDWLMKKGTPEFLDFVATAIGGLVGYALFSL